MKSSYLNLESTLEVRILRKLLHLIMMISFLYAFSCLSHETTKKIQVETFLVESSLMYHCIEELVK